jgi:hypothetical protein
MPIDVYPDAGSALIQQAEDDPSLRKEKED